jgi:hypothetical protein
LTIQAAKYKNPTGLREIQFLPFVGSYGISMNYLTEAKIPFPKQLSSNPFIQRGQGRCWAQINVV